MVYLERRERWKRIPDFPWYYEVSDLGRIRSLARKDRRGWNIRTRFLSISDGEVFVEGRCCPIASLILKAFVGVPSSASIVARHLNDNRADNNLKNLAWGTHHDNHVDALRNGRTYISYGHLGKPHSEETKQHLRLMFLGKPTGRRMTTEHKKALLSGYRKKFPLKLKRRFLCACGCGLYAQPGNKVRHGHSGGRKKAQ